MTLTPDVDHWARQLMKRLEPTLRSQLGSESLEREFVTRLYLRFRQSLGETKGLEDMQPSEFYLDRLALDVYLSAATHLEGHEVGPKFLSSVKSILGNSLDELSRESELTDL